MSAISGIVGSPAASGGGIQQIMAMRQQIIDRSDLLKQIHAAQNTTQTDTATSTVQSPAQGFADTLKTALDSVNSVQSNAENVTDAYQKGEVTDVAKVMLARQEAGVAFEATLQVRNKLLSAYQDIMRMGL